jgi:hypothetical protein
MLPCPGKQKQADRKSKQGKGIDGYVSMNGELSYGCG